MTLHSQPGLRDPDAPQVFVVRGDLTKLACDDVLVPTDANLMVHKGFRPLVALKPTRGTYRQAIVAAPPDWSGSGSRALRVPHADAPRPWLVNTGGTVGAPLEWLLDGLDLALDAVAEHAAPPAHGRARRLVALPLIGAGAGGYRSRRGVVCREVLNRLDRWTQRVGADAVLVVQDKSDYAALQSVRRDLDMAGASVDGSARQVAEGLAERARSGELVLFLGAGLSAAAGLPTWSELLDVLGTAARLPDEVRAGLEHLSPLDVAELIERSLDRAEVERLVREQLSQNSYGLSHALVASWGVQAAVTTNYDTLYETAHVAGNRETPPLRVLPRQTVQPHHPWLLKLHGDVNTSGSIVLTRGDYVRYDASNRPSASLVQALLMTNHMLFVGFSLIDDNFVRLSNEVRQILKSAEGQGPVGTVLALAPEPAREQLWKGDLDFLTFGGRTSRARAARRLEVFLDLVGSLACGDISYLLNPAYEDLLSSDDEELSGLLQRLVEAARAGGDSDAWTSARSWLTSLGARLP